MWENAGGDGANFHEQAAPPDLALPAKQLPTLPTCCHQATCYGRRARDGDLGLAGVQVVSDVAHDSVDCVYQAQHHSVVLKTEGNLLSDRMRQVPQTQKLNFVITLPAFLQRKYTLWLPRVLAGQPLSSQRLDERSKTDSHTVTPFHRHGGDQVRLLNPAKLVESGPGPR